MKRGFVIFGGIAVIVSCTIWAWRVKQSAPVLATAVLEGPPPNSDLPLISGLARSPNGDIIATVSDNKVVELWDVKTGRLLQTLQGPQEWLFSPAFSPDGSVLATASSLSSFNKQYGRLQLWNPGSVERLATIDGIDWPRCVKFSPLGTVIAVG